MPKRIPDDSVGLVEPKIATFSEPLSFECGRVLEQYALVYETYGSLNADKSNAVLVCHALSGDHHAAGYHSMKDNKPGWWESCIGPGKPIDTNHFFVVSLNNLGGCAGSTGPTSTNPATGKPFGPDFPLVTVKDWVTSQARLADRIGIDCWSAVIGGSLGGMQALQWSIDYPDRLKNCVVIAAAPKLSTQNIAFNEVARAAIMNDPAFAGGHYYEGPSPDQGLKLARMLGHITYVSDDALKAKFGRDLKEGRLSFQLESEFQIESYLQYKGSEFVKRFDANTYLLMTRALDYFDPAGVFDNSLSDAMSQARCNFLVASFTSDWRFSPARSREIVKALHDADLDVTYLEIDDPAGHDGFLMAIPEYTLAFGAYMQHIARRLNHG